MIIRVSAVLKVISIRLLVITFVFLVAVTARRTEALDPGAESFRAGCAQIFFGADVQKNIEKILYFIQRADSLEVDVLVFPETALSGYASIDFKNTPFPSKEVLNEALDRVREAARETGIWVIIGTSAIEQDGCTICCI